MGAFEKAILNSAKREAKRILNEAKKEAESILKNTEEEWKKREKEVLKKAEEEGAERAKEITATASLEAKRVISNAMDSIVERTIEKVIDEMKAFFESKEGAKLIEETAKKAEKELGAVIVIVPKNYKGAIKGFKVSKELNSPAGFMVMRKDRKAGYNFTVEELLNVYRDDIRRIVYKEEFE